ncbi:MAG: hypothetical protein LBI53_01375 [Candidatus Peribacteria bacterium]|nr:hypothetical protein [Candidatus Peribacteria bacterium]
MDSSRKYAVIDALDKGDDGLNELENSQESITLMTARNLGIALSGDIFVDNELKIKFSELSAKLDTGGSATGEINSIVDEINKNITDPDPLIGVGAKITELETDNTNLITEITEIESGVSTLVINPGEGITYFETL